ncbi:MAG: ribosome rescue protein RqcH, partial [Thermoplasmatota archaeon]
VDLFIKIGGYLFLTPKVKAEMPREASRYAMILRKSLRNRVLEDVTQTAMDRIIVLHFSKGFDDDAEMKLYIEIFGDGNIILTADDVIIAPYTSRSWASRTIKRGEVFSPPPTGADPGTISLDDVKRLIDENREDLVHFLIRRIGLPPVYSEEICFRADIPKDLPMQEMAEAEVESVHVRVVELLDELKNGSGACLHIKDGSPAFLEPVLLRSFFSERVEEEIIRKYSEINRENGGLELFTYDSLSEAVEDIMFDSTGMIPPGERSRKRAIDRYAKLLENQQKALRDREKEAVRFSSLAESIYLDYARIDSLLKNFDPGRYAEDKGSYPDVLSYNRDPSGRGGIIRTRINTPEGEDFIDLDILLDINANAELLYEKAKRAKRKAEGIKKAIASSEKKMRKAEEMEEDRVERPVPLRKFWFESYRWCFSSEGILLIGGRDARSNERLVKKYMRDQDLYAHADIKGAPSVVVRDEKDKLITEATKREGCHFSVLNSKAWTARIGSEGGYWVLPDQVSRTPQAGEFLPKGSFMIRGKKNYIGKLPLVGAAGLIYVEGVPKVMFGPESAINSNCSGTYFRITPGKNKKSDVAKIISRELGGELDQIQSVLPPGDMEILRIERIDPS